MVISRSVHAPRRSCLRNPAGCVSSAAWSRTILLVPATRRERVLAMVLLSPSAHALCPPASGLATPQLAGGRKRPSYYFPVSLTRSAPLRERTRRTRGPTPPSLVPAHTGNALSDGPGARVARCNRGLVLMCVSANGWKVCTGTSAPRGTCARSENGLTDFMYPVRYIRTPACAQWALLHPPVPEPPRGVGPKGEMLSAGREGAPAFSRPSDPSHDPRTRKVRSRGGGGPWGALIRCVGAQKFSGAGGWARGGTWVLRGRSEVDQ